MADQARGFRKFVLDPKSSVMTYIAENIPQAHQQGDPSLGSSQQNSITGQQVDPNNANWIQQNGHPQDPYAQQAQSSQGPFSQAYIASNLNQPIPSPANGSLLESVPRPDPPQWQIGGQNPYSQQATSVQDPLARNNAQSIQSLLSGPPPAGARRVTFPQSAQRQYHRMVLDFERAKNVFSVAQSQHNFQEMASTAYELEAQSRRIWSLRVEHAWEFEGFTEEAHQSVISGWHSQFELWADTVLDIQEGHFNPTDAKPDPYGSSLTSTTSEGWDSQRRQEHSGNAGIDSRLGANMPVQASQMPQMQNLSLSQNSPAQQNLPYPGVSQPTPPGAFPQSSPAGPNGNSVNPGNPMGQQQPSAQLQQMPMGQSMTTNMASSGQNGQPMQQSGPLPNPQNGQPVQQLGPLPNLHNGQPMQQAGSLPNQKSQGTPSGQGSYQQAHNTLQGGPGLSQQGQNLPPGAGPGPNSQQGQNMPPGSNGYGPQGQAAPPGGGPNMPQRQNISQGPPLNMQQRPNAAQGPAGPPRNQTPPVQNMQARPQMPGILQAGAPPQGNVRQ